MNFNTIRVQVWLCVFVISSFAFETVLVYCTVSFGGLTECRGHVVSTPLSPILSTWIWYAESFDPVFLHTPNWLLWMCAIDGFLFGPTYVYLAYAFHQRSPTYRTISLLWAGAVTYSTLVYFGYEVFWESHRSDLIWVFIINIPWTIVLILHAKDVARISGHTH
eukprot:m.110391 g.110391  ORF g.110391 m.110391 type:complete len:164 (-) comp28033_c0_seq1:148-639(-)